MSLTPFHIHLAVRMNDLAAGKRFIKFEDRTSKYLRKKMNLSALEIGRLLQLFKTNRAIKITTNINGECLCVFRPGFNDILKLSGLRSSSPGRRTNPCTTQRKSLQTVPA